MAEPTQAPSWTSFVDAATAQGTGGPDLDTLKDAYFGRFIAPHFDEKDLGAARRAFDEQATMPEYTLSGEASKALGRGLNTLGQGLVGTVATGMESVERNYPGTIAPENLQRIRQMERQQQVDRRPYESAATDWDNVHGAKGVGRFLVGNTVEGLATSLPQMVSGMGGASLLGKGLYYGGTAASAYGTELGQIHADAANRADIESFLNNADPTEYYKNIDTAKLAGGTGAAGSLEFAQDILLGPFRKLGGAAISKYSPVDLINLGESGLGKAATVAAKGISSAAGEGITERYQTPAEHWGAGDPRTAHPLDLSNPQIRQEANTAGISAFGGALIPGLGGAMIGPKTPDAPPATGPTYEDQLRAEGIHPDQSGPAAPDPREEVAKSKEESLARVQSLEAAVPSVFRPKKPGDSPNKLLNFSEFAKHVEDEWKSRAPTLSEDQLGEEYSKAVLQDPNLEPKKFFADRKKAELAKYAEENPKLSGAQINQLWMDYKDLHRQGIRGFKAAYNWLDQQYADLVEPSNPDFAAHTPVAGMPAPASEGLPPGVGWTNTNKPVVKNPFTYEGLPPGVGQTNKPVVKSPFTYEGVPTSPLSAGSPTLPGVSDGQVQSTVQEGQPPADLATQGTITPTVTSAVPQPRKAPGRGNKIDPETDDLIVAIRRLGGINVDLESDFKGRLSGIETPKIVGLPNVERTKGKGRSLDDLAEALYEHGYLKSRDVEELSDRLSAAEQSPQWALGKQDFSEEQTTNDPNRWIEQVDRAGSADALVEVAKAAGEDPRFRSLLKNDPDFKQRWFDAVDNAQSFFEDAPAQPPVAPVEQDLFAAATPEEKAQADTLALAERQKDVQRNLNATQAPQGGGLFDQDNRQTEIGDLNASNTPGSVAGNVPPVVTGAPQTASPMRTAGGTVAGPARGTDGGGVAGVDTGRSGGELGQSGAALDPEIANLSREELRNQIRYSQGEAPAQGTTAEAITGILGDSPRIQVHKTLADAEKATGQKLKGNAKAFVLNGKAHFIADRIAPGSELGVFLHEVGAHLGMERILSKGQMDNLIKQVEQWAKSGKGTQKAAAEAAMRRSGGNQAEVIAHFVEEAANRGVSPTDTKSAIGRWLGQVWRAVKSALAKWGFKGIDKLTAQDLVDFAYGAAKVEMQRPDAGTNQVRYSLQDEAKQASQQFTDALKDFFGDVRKRKGSMVLNPHQVATIFDKYPSAQAYADAAQLMEAQRLHNQKRIARLTTKLAKLPKADRNATLELMTRSTLTGAHPDIGLYDKEEQEIDGHKVEVSNEHLKSKANGAAAHAKMAAEYRALSPEAKKLYTSIRNHFADSWAQRIKTVEDLANEPDVDPSVRNRLLRDMKAVKAKVVGPYFPLMRDGRFAVVWKSPRFMAMEDAVNKGTGSQKDLDALKENDEDFWVRFTDSETEAQRLSTEPPEEIAEGAEGYYKIRTVLTREADGASSKFMSDLEEALARKIGDPETRGEVLQSVRGVFLETLPELSVMRRTVMRHRVNGVKAEDMLQSIARAGSADSHYLARTTHMGALLDALNSLKKEDTNPRRGVKIDPTTPGTPKGGIGRAYEFMLNSFQRDLLRPEPNSLNGMANKLVQLSYLYSLALDTGNLIANVLQPQLTAAPIMGGRFGLAKAEGALVKALTESLGALQFRNGDVDVSKLPDTNGERQAISTLMDQGMIELSQSRELSMVARGSRKNQLSSAWTNTLEVAGWASHNVETLSRLATTLAAYRLELQRIKSDPNYAAKSEQERQAMAVKYASKMSNETLGNYTPGGAPLALRGNHQALTRLALQFKRYAVTMLFLYGKTARDAHREAKKGEFFREGQKSLIYLLGFQFAIAGGLAGLPAALPAKLIAALFPGEDDDESEEDKLDRLALEVAGGDKKLALVLRKGPLSALTGVDWGRKMGLQDLGVGNVSGIGETLVNTVAEGRRMVMGKGQVPARGPSKESPAEWAVDNFIPSASAVERLQHGLEEISNGYLEDGIATLLPKSMFASLYTELYKERTRKLGLTNKSGLRAKLGPEAYSDWDIFAKAIGLPLTIESEAWANAEAFDERKQPKADRRANLLERYVAAKRLGETDKAAELKQDIKAFNESLPEDLRPSMRITEADMISRVQSTAKANKQTAQSGGVNATKKEGKWARSITKSSPYTP